MRISFFLLLYSAIIASCSDSQEQEHAPTKTKIVATEQGGESKPDQMTMDSLMTSIDLKRMEIEEGLADLEKKTLQSGALREQVKQKWSEIHFFYDGQDLKRILSTSKEGSSTRTEEFYFHNGQLLTAVIEDEGAAELGMEESITGKIHYFQDGEPIGMRDNTGEKDYSIRKSDGERMLQEAKEYMEISNDLDKYQQMVAGMGGK